jgi:hypothetical protein
MCRVIIEELESIKKMMYYLERRTFFILFQLFYGNAGRNKQNRLP